MNKRFLYILTATVVILVVNLVNNSSVHGNQLASYNKTQALIKSHFSSSFTTLDFISETEDDISEGKFQIQSDNIYGVNYFKYKTLAETRRLYPNALCLCNIALYQSVPIYISIGNHRV